MHAKLMDKDSGIREWFWISEFLPKPIWALLWDRAERLRFGFLEKFADNPDIAARLIDCNLDHESWILLLNTIGRSRRGYEVLQTMFSLTSKSKSPPWKVKALEESIFPESL